MARLYFFILAFMLVYVCAAFPDGFGCVEPGHRPNSRVTFDLPVKSNFHRYPTTTKASYACDKGRYMIGHYQRVCQNNGTWSGEPPICGVSVTTDAIISSIRPNVVDANYGLDSNYTTCSVAKFPASWHVVLNRAHNVTVIRVVAKNDNPHMESVVIKVSIALTDGTNNQYEPFPAAFSRFYIGTSANESYAVYELITSTPVEAKFFHVHIESGVYRNMSHCLKSFGLCELAIFSESALSTDACRAPDNDNTEYGIYGRKCYSIHYTTYSSLEWVSARCPSGWALASHIEFDESVFVSHFITRLLGADESVTRLWIGGRRTSQKAQWKWLDGSPVTTYTVQPYNYWKRNKPMCLQFWRDRATFESDYCEDSTSAKYWLCSKEIVECGIPEQKEATMMMFDGVTTGSVAKYSCPDGHVMSSSSESPEGQLQRHCMNNSLWSGEAPKCDYIDCGHMNVEGGHPLPEADLL